MSDTPPPIPPHPYSPPPPPGEQTPPPIPPFAAGAEGSEWATGGATGEATAGATVNERGRYVDPTATAAQRTYAVFMHLTLILATAAPVLSVVAPLTMWLIKKDESHFLDDHGRETLNFHISILIYGLLSLLLMLVCVGWPILILTYVLGIVGMIQASTAANRGEFYRYPACLRLVR